jgi:hypothetical protein
MAVNAFNDMLRQFLDDLAGVFPEETVFLETKAKVDGSEWMERFQKSTSLRQAELMNKDSGFFSDRNRFMKEIGIQKIWRRKDISEDTRGKIWAYIQNLNAMCMMMSMLPPEMMSMVEEAADKCAQDVQNGAELNEQTIMASMGPLLAKMMGGKISQ